MSKTIKMLSALGIWALTGGALASQAQCLSLAQLLHVGATPAGSSPQDPAPNWTYHAPGADEELYWTFRVDGAPQADSLPKSRLSFYRADGSVDVTFKTLDDACVAALRAELRQLKLKEELVTCVNCSATRYADSTGYTVFIYRRSTGAYPHTVVLRQPEGSLTAGQSPAPTTTRP